MDFWNVTKSILLVIKGCKKLLTSVPISSIMILSSSFIFFIFLYILIPFILEDLKTLAIA